MSVQISEAAITNEAEKSAMCSMVRRSLSVVPVFVWRLSRLHHLNLSNNDLSQFNVPDQITLPQLYELNLDKNKFTEFPQAIARFGENLRTLTIAGNKIKHLPNDVFSLLSNLRHFDACCNDISHLPASLGRCPLNALLLQGNPIAESPKFRKNTLQQTLEELRGSALDDLGGVFGSLLTTGHLADVVLVVGPPQRRCYWKVHSCVLAPQSLVFSTMLRVARTLNKGSNSDDLLTLPFSDGVGNCISERSARILLEYMYTQHVAIHPSMVVQITALAKLYGISELHRQCVDYTNTHVQKRAAQLQSARDAAAKAESDAKDLMKAKDAALPQPFQGQSWGCTWYPSLYKAPENWREVVGKQTAPPKPPKVTPKTEAPMPALWANDAERWAKTLQTVYSAVTKSNSSSPSRQFHCSMAEAQQLCHKAVADFSATLTVETSADIKDVKPATTITPSEAAAPTPEQTQQHQGQMFLSQLSASTATDVKIVSKDGGVFTAHRAVLASRSPVLAAMLGASPHAPGEQPREPMNGTTTQPSSKAVDNVNKITFKESQDNVITFPAIDSEVIQLLLRFFYCGSAAKMTFEEAFTMFPVADFLLIDQLTEFCMGEILIAINDDTAMRIFEYNAATIDNMVIDQKCRQVITLAKSKRDLEKLNTSRPVSAANAIPTPPPLPTLLV